MYSGTLKKTLFYLPAGLSGVLMVLIFPRAGLDYLARENLVIKMAGTDFFEKIRGTSVVSLYNNEMAWAHFGYEGASYEMGGYFDRGFQDLDWLPDPDSDASPAKA